MERVRESQGRVRDGQGESGRIRQSQGVSVRVKEESGRVRESVWV